MSQTPTSIGKYDVEGVVGEGAMGVVYRAMDRVLNRRVAIKVMSDAIAKDRDLRERFLREAQAAGSLQHPNVVTIYDFGEVDDHLYIAMEYVEGDDLEDILARAIPLPLDDKLGLIVDVLQGLAFAHKRGVVHRDIKPANIRIDVEGRARLMDFGIAHLDSSKMTRTGMMLGTPSYMAPEQIVGGAVSAATDIFSVGAVLYELLTGARPFKGDTLQSLMYQVLSQEPEPPHKANPELPDALDRVVARAMRKTPSERYPGALDMASDLVAIRATLLPDGHRGTLSLRATIDSALAVRNSGIRTVRRRRLSYMAGGGILAALAIGGLALQLPREAPTAVADAADSAASARTAGEEQPATALVATEDADRKNAAQPAPMPAAPPPPAGPSAAEIAIARQVQSAAISARARAVIAGATVAQLRAGDEHNLRGESLLRRERISEAVGAFGSASAAWAGAERVARQASLDRSEPVAVAAAPSITVPHTPSPQLPVATGGAQLAPPPPVAARAPLDHAAEVAATVATYARALESRDILQLQRAYPGMTSEQRRAFEDFFRSTRSLTATLAVASLQVDGTLAQAQLTGTYEYVTSGGSSERQLVSFRALLRHEQGAWRLTSVR